MIVHFRIYNDGGGIYLLNSTFDHNIVDGSGTAFYNPFYFEYPTFVDNNATVTGGMHVSLYGEESIHGQFCFKVLNFPFDSNYARKSGQDAF